MSEVGLQQYAVDSAIEDAPAAEITQPFTDFRQMCPKDVLRMVTGMLNEIVNANDSLPFNENRLTRFHSRAPAGISIKDYLVRVVKFTSLDPAILIVLVYYIDLLSQSYPNFVVNSLTVHRFIITSVTVASKGLCDSFCLNSHYAKVGGLQQMELNLLEVEFLTRVSYRIAPSHEIFDQYFASMLLRHGPKRGGQSESPPLIPAPAAEPVPESRSASASQLDTASPSSPDEGPEKNKFSRKMKNLFHPVKKRGAEGSFGDSKRPKQ